MSIFNNFPAVGAGGDTSDATATAADILQGKTAYGADGKITGTIKSIAGGQVVPKAAGQIAAAGNVYTTGARIIPKEDNFIPANIRKDVSIWGVVGTLDPGSTPTPDPNLIPANVKAGVTINGVTGTFTNDATITADYILDGFSGYAQGAKITGNIPSKDTATYTPGTADQYINAEQYLSGSQKIAGDANLVAGNIAQGKSIFGVTGTYTNDANATAESMQLGVSAYVKGARVVGTAPIQAAKTVTPTTTEQTAVASGSFTSGAVKVAGDANLVAENIKSGVSIFGVAGAAAAGQNIEGKFVTVDSTGTGKTLLTCTFTPNWALIGGYFSYSGGSSGAQYYANGTLSKSGSFGALSYMNMSISGSNVVIDKGGFIGSVIAGDGEPPTFDTTPLSTNDEPGEPDETI
jgi:hypothetical protein|nr:MAG TPA: tail protein [Caudoviricetes sp.]